MASESKAMTKLIRLAYQHNSGLVCDARGQKLEPANVNSDEFEKSELDEIVTWAAGRKADYLKRAHEEEAFLYAILTSGSVDMVKLAAVNKSGTMLNICHKYSLDPVEVGLIPKPATRSVNSKMEQDAKKFDAATKK